MKGTVTRGREKGSKKPKNREVIETAKVRRRKMKLLAKLC